MSRMMHAPNSRSWIVSFAVCKDCGSNLIICQSPKADYWWYCSDKLCENHNPGEQLGDMEECSFAKTVEDE